MELMEQETHFCRNMLQAIAALYVCAGLVVTSYAFDITGILCAICAL